MDKPSKLTLKRPPQGQTDLRIELPMQFYIGNTLQISKIPQFHYFFNVFPIFNPLNLKNQPKPWLL